MGGHEGAWWKVRVPKEGVTKKERRVGLRRTRRCVFSTAFTKSNADRLAKRHTIHGLPSAQEIPVLRTEWMRIDVELCGQILMMRRREAHLEGVVKCLEVCALVFIFGASL